MKGMTGIYRINPACLLMNRQNTVRIQIKNRMASNNKNLNTFIKIYRQ